MSRIGKLPVTVPAGVEVSVDDKNLVTVKGPKGTLTQQISSLIKIENKDGALHFSPIGNAKGTDAQFGLARSLVHNMVVGVTDGFQKTLEINGVGYRAAKNGNVLNLTLGYSHPIEYPEPEGIEIEVPDQTKIIVKGISKEKVGQAAAEIRAFRGPEPYKGKGIKYAEEHIRRKVAKTGK